MRTKNTRSTWIGFALIILTFAFFGWMLSSGAITVDEIPELMEHLDVFSWKLVAIVAGFATISGGVGAVLHKPKTK